MLIRKVIFLLILNGLFGLCLDEAIRDSTNQREEVNDWQLTFEKIDTSDVKSFCWNSSTIYCIYTGFSLLLAINFHRFSQPDQLKKRQTNNLERQIYRDLQWRIQDFPEEGRQLPLAAPTYDFAKCSQKLHEIEIIWTPRGACPWRPLRSATVFLINANHVTFNTKYWAI